MCVYVCVKISELPPERDMGDLMSLGRARLDGNKEAEMEWFDLEVVWSSLKPPSRSVSSEIIHVPLRSQAIDKTEQGEGWR